MAAKMLPAQWKQGGLWPFVA